LTASRRDITCREYRPKDREGLVQLHNACFPPVSTDYWREWDRNDVTAAIAVVADEVVGCVPFHLRAFTVRPDVHVTAAFEYSVCVREDLRSHGVGSALMECAAQFLKGRADVMMVYRGGEASPGYRFYARNQHHDVVLLRPTVWEKPGAAAVPGSVTVHKLDEMLRCESEVLEVFRAAYGAFGGYPQRAPGHYRLMSGNMNWEEVKHDWTFLACRRQGRLLGYALAGLGLSSQRWRVAELAAPTGDETADALLDAVAQLAGDTPVSFHMTRDDPMAAALQRRGAAPLPRSRSSMMIMAKLFDPEALARKVWDSSVELREAEVIAWTPQREACLYRAPAPVNRRITLEMKDDILARMLVGRLDAAAAYQQDLITVTGAGPGDVDAIARALPFCPWVHHDIDYI